MQGSPICKHPLAEERIQSAQPHPQHLRNRCSLELQRNIHPQSSRAQMESAPQFRSDGMTGSQMRGTRPQIGTTTQVLDQQSGMREQGAALRAESRLRERIWGMQPQTWMQSDRAWMRREQLLQLMMSPD